MGKAYLLDLRVRISDYISSGHSRRAAGRVFGVSARTAIRLAAGVRDRGSLAPLVQGHAAGTAGKLTPHRAFLLEIVAAEPDITLAELARALADTYGVKVQLSSVHRAVVRAGLSYEKRSDRAGAWARRPEASPV